jgi:hypothetical protein
VVLAGDTRDVAARQEEVFVVLDRERQNSHPGDESHQSEYCCLVFESDITCCPDRHTTDERRKVSACRPHLFQPTGSAQVQNEREAQVQINASHSTNTGIFISLMHYF